MWSNWNSRNAAGGRVNWHAHLGKLEACPKAELMACNFTPGCTHVHPNAHTRILMEVTNCKQQLYYPPTVGCLHKCVSSQSQILIHHENEGTIIACKNMDESLKHKYEWKKSTFCVTLSVPSPNTQRDEVRQWWRGGSSDWKGARQDGAPGGLVLFPLIWFDFCLYQCVPFVKIIKLTHLRWVHFLHKCQEQIHSKTMSHWVQSASFSSLLVECGYNTSQGGQSRKRGLAWNPGSCSHHQWARELAHLPGATFFSSVEWGEQGLHHALWRWQDRACSFPWRHSLISCHEPKKYV